MNNGEFNDNTDLQKGSHLSDNPTETSSKVVMVTSDTSGDNGDVEEEAEVTKTHKKGSSIMPVYDAEQSPVPHNKDEESISDEESNSMCWESDDNDCEELTSVQNEFIRNEFVTIASHSIDRPFMPLELDHKLLFRPHLLPDAPPRPYPAKYRDRWDKDHVRMPCSNENQCPMSGKILRRWGVICDELPKPMRTSFDFELAIMKYNSHYQGKWNFDGWHVFCNQVLCESEREELFHCLLPRIARLAMRLPDICTHPIPFLRQQKKSKLTMSQEQIACLLANAFFCTFPRRNSLKRSEYSSFPSINFNRLYSGIEDVIINVRVEKLRCLLHYFKRVTHKMPIGTLTFSRKVLKDKEHQSWTQSKNHFCDLIVSSTGSIEDEGKGFVEVDFANRFVGGGVIAMGCVQEEIRFLICPEMIISRLFTESLEKNESLVIKGCERFSSYTGYAQTFKWQGDYTDNTLRDSWGRRHVEVVAMDALVFHKYEDQFQPDRLDRELNKACCGFYCSSPWHRKPPAIATGNWGCGAFGGTSNIKALVQLMAASVYNRDMLYCTFGDKVFAKDLRSIHAFLTKNVITVGQLRRALRSYEREIRSEEQFIELYPYLRDTLCNKVSSPAAGVDEIIIDESVDTSAGSEDTVVDKSEEITADNEEIIIDKSIDTVADDDQMEVDKSVETTGENGDMITDKLDNAADSKDIIIDKSVDTLASSEETGVDKSEENENIIVKSEKTTTADRKEIAVENA